MTERRYTVVEIDKMRERVSWKLAPKFPMEIDGETVMCARSDCPADRTAVEEQLRTYMLAGIGPEELEAHYATKE